MNNQQKMLMLGNIGEKLIRYLAQEEGCEVREYPSLYDSEKDLTINGKTCEVKTQVPFFVEDAFTVKKNQIRKCKNVDILLFVESPNKGNVIRVYSAPKEKREFRHRKTKDGRDMYLLDKSGMNMIYSVTDSNLANEMRQNSNSSW